MKQGSKFLGVELKVYFCKKVYMKRTFYSDLVYRLRKIVGNSNFSEQVRKPINRYKRIGYSLDIMRQTACLFVNPVIANDYASLFNWTTAVRASDSMTSSSQNFNQWVGFLRFVFSVACRGSTIGFHLL